jgi:hypothetical protein
MVCSFTEVCRAPLEEEIILHEEPSPEFMMYTKLARFGESPSLGANSAFLTSVTSVLFISLKTHHTMSSSLYQQQLCSEPQEIRTLTLKQGAFDDPIHCTLQTVSLADNPKYTALSYVWGDATERLPIYIDGTLFSATKNLKIALQYIRKADCDQVMWVDAVCINQNDIDERNDQVSLMGKLFSDAEHVIIWLGEADDTTDEMVRIVQGNKLPIPPAPEDQDFEQSHLQYAIQVHRLLTLIEIITLRPWWGRVWTVQECVLPNNDPSFQCGLRTFSCSKFFQVASEAGKGALSILSTIFDHVDNPNVYEIWEYRQKLSKGATSREIKQRSQGLATLRLVYNEFKVTASINLESCVFLSIERQATVPHDSIYGVLGLATAEVRMKTNVDYRRSHWAVYRDFFKQLLTDAGSHGLKALTTLSYDTDTDERPSWVPDFASQRNVIRYIGRLLSVEEGFQKLKKVPESDNDEIIILRGVSLDVIELVHKMQDEEEDWDKHMFDIAQQVLREAVCKDETNSIPKAIIDASKKAHISQLFLGFLQGDGNITPDASQVAFHWDIIAEHHYAGKSLTDFFHAESKPPLLELGGMSLVTFLLRIRSQTYAVGGSRKVIISRAGLSGLSVTNAQPGDEIVCLNGFHMPFVLRPRMDHYRMVGWAYLPGLMDWSVLTECLDKGSLYETNFEIH